MVVGTVLLVGGNAVEDGANARGAVRARDIVQRLLRGLVLGGVLGDLVEVMVVGTVGALLDVVEDGHGLKYEGQSRYGQCFLTKLSLPRSLPLSLPPLPFSLSLLLSLSGVTTA